MLALLIALSAWPHLLAPWAQEQCTEIKMKGKEFFALFYFTCFDFDGCILGHVLPTGLTVP